MVDEKLMVTMTSQDLLEMNLFQKSSVPLPPTLRNPSGCSMLSHSDNNG